MSAINENNYPLLSKVKTPYDLRKLPVKKLPSLCAELRAYLIETLSSVGGHFSSNLGVIELTVALHYVFNTPKDRLIWDVGHQIYPHKILTGRREKLSTVRHLGGLSGFPKREESIYDLYETGHAGTSISQLLGEAIARDKLNLSHKCVCVIGDASIASGMAFEALNHGGQIDTDCLVILNDNDMSISRNVGALNEYLNRLNSSPFFTKWKKLWYMVMLWLPLIGPAVRTFSRKMERTFIDLFTPGGFFTNLGFHYVGPIDGHNITTLIKVIKKLNKIKKPILLHVYTQKGQGYQPAEKNPIRYHSVTSFNPKDGMFSTNSKEDTISYSSIVGNTLLDLARKNSKIVAITPAMIEGSGLRPFYEAMPERVFDVGIAEQHSVAFAGALASGGLIPYLCIYSTFLTRGLDQLIQDVALMNLPVRIVIDRAGCVGPDGETHQGLYDIGFLLAIPNIQIFAPASGYELASFLKYMEGHGTSPIAVRFPKAVTLRKDLLVNELAPSVLSHKPVILENDKASIAFLCIGSMWDLGIQLKEELKKELNIEVKLLGLRWLRPMDWTALEKAFEGLEYFAIIEESYEYASGTSYILQSLSPKLATLYLKTFAFPTLSIEHGKREEILAKYQMSLSSILDFFAKHPYFLRKLSF